MSEEADKPVRRRRKPPEVRKREDAIRLAQVRQWVTEWNKQHNVSTSFDDRRRSARSLEAKIQILTEWADDWHEQHRAVMTAIDRALFSSNIVEIGQYLQKLKAIDDKAFAILPRAIRAGA